MYDMLPYQGQIKRYKSLLYYLMKLVAGVQWNAGSEDIGGLSVQT